MALIGLISERILTVFRAGFLSCYAGANKFHETCLIWLNHAYADDDAGGFLFAG
jgi:hypothetical protein